MTRHSRYPSSQSLLRVSLIQIAGEIGRTPMDTSRLLVKYGFIGLHGRRGSKSKAITYDASALEVLKAMLGIPHRVVGEHEDDWLSRYTNNGGKNGKI